MHAHAEAVVAQVRLRLARGLAAWAVHEPVSLCKWSEEHFYLSAESSYVEQRWTPWTFQRAIMACISNDDIYEVDLKKSARVGYTKILLADICYTSHHKRRNQAIWQPTDEDRDEFVKTELDPVLRDIPVMRDVLPTYLARHKDNTLQQKKFIGSMLHMKGGKAAKNYRRISVDSAKIDEADAFDRDIEKEGDPFTLAAKRVEGATFPKVVVGGTPKLKGFSLIDDRFQLADFRFTFQIPCPHCGERHALTWGGKDEPHGLKFTDRNPDTVRHLCPHCATLIDQGEYLAVESQGIWVSDDNTLHLTTDDDGNPVFTTPDGAPAPTPRHIAFHVWTAYSPAVTWAAIVREFIAARAAMETGDESKMKAWTNTTLGECWEGEIERTDADELKARAEPFPLRILQRDCLLLLCATDTQGNRLEAQVWGIGRGGQMWTIDHQVFYGNPAQEDVWLELEDFLFATTYQHASGTTQRIYATAIDSGGHHADAVYSFAHKHRARRVYAIKGASGAERSIENGNTKVGFNWQGKREKHGPVLWHVGTHLAKDRFAARLEVQQPGPGYVHLSRDNTDEWFRQLAAEDRVTARSQYGTVTRWVPNRKRNEVIDMTAYVIWLEERLDLWAQKKRKWWDELEEQVQPVIADLFAAPPQSDDHAADPAPPRRAEAPTARPSIPPRKQQPIARSDWSSRL
ncbi:MAG: phage terminase large subunit family protein [Opitutaceae bacterium]|nr:phage terminase large subunit family protein [Opitutaceae bacterium]